MLNLFVVESKNDVAFFKALIGHLNLSASEVDEPIFPDEDSFLTIDGSDPDSENPTSLIRKLIEIQTDIVKKGICKVGIILDLDNKTLEEKIKMVNQALKSSFDGANSIGTINKTGEFAIISNSEWEISVACYFTNYRGRGELETLLRKIACWPSIYADCLSAWKECVEHHGKTISDKDFDKFWISNYIRFDTCTKKEKQQAEKYCSMINFNHVLQKGIFNFDSPELYDLKKFLMIF